MWRKRSQAIWIKEGDQNTRFFHSVTTWRNRRKTIVKLCGENGEIYSNNDEIGDAFVSYFTDLFHSSSHGDNSSILDTINCSISNDENLILERPYSAIDVKEALDNMYLEKAPWVQMV